MEYTFTLKYQLNADDPDPNTVVERLAEAGCEDALVGTGRPGWLALEFTREAASAAGAIRSALDDVRRAVASAHLVEVAPDLVGLTDVAEMVGMSRQYMRRLTLTQGGNGFPPPVHEGNPSIWHLADILSWLHENTNYAPNRMSMEMAMETAQAAMQVNVARESRRLAHTDSQSESPLR